MRLFAYGTTIVALAFGMVWASSYAALLVAFSVAIVFGETDFLFWSVYAVVSGALAGRVVYFTVRAVLTARREGPPESFRGWRYWAAGLCGLMLLPALVMVALLVLHPEGRKLLVMPIPVGLNYLPVVLLALAALPGRRGP